MCVAGGVIIHSGAPPTPRRKNGSGTWVLEVFFVGGVVAQGIHINPNERFDVSLSIYLSLYCLLSRVRIILSLTRTRTRARDSATPSSRVSLEAGEQIDFWKSMKWTSIPYVSMRRKGGK